MDINIVQPEARPAANHHASDMRSGVFAARNDRPNQVTGSEAKVTLLLRHVADWKAVLVRPTLLSGSMPRTADQQDMAYSDTQTINWSGQAAGRLMKGQTPRLVS
jgi:hypothetical protein